MSNIITDATGPETPDGDRGFHALTRTKPECPAWCTILEEGHAVEAADPRGSWYYHAFVVPLDDEVGRVTLSVCQTFEEHLRPGESDSPGTMFVEIAPDELSVAQAGSLAEALVAAVAAATGAQSPS